VTTGGKHPRSDAVEPTRGPGTASRVSASHPSWRWLRSTRELQEHAFHVDFDEYKRDPDALADSIVWNHTALVVELSEFLGEVGWKTWSTPRGWVNRDAAVGELVDAAHFLANILVRLDVTDDEWERRYRDKQEVNRKRQANGYDARIGKCPGCGRAYDDAGVDCVDQRVSVGASDASVGPVTEIVRSAWCAVKRQAY